MDACSLSNQDFRNTEVMNPETPPHQNSFFFHICLLILTLPNMRWNIKKYQEKPKLLRSLNSLEFPRILQRTWPSSSTEKKRKKHQRWFCSDFELKKNPIFYVNRLSLCSICLSARRLTYNSTCAWLRVSLYGPVHSTHCACFFSLFI